MGKFKLYDIDLKNLTPGIHEYDYLLENKFFADIDGTEVQKGKVNAHVTVKKGASMYELNFKIDGVAIVPCDRCLDDMEIPVTSKNRLFVKFGKEYAEESDEVVVVPEEDGDINIAWFLYEFISLSVPLKHVHAPGECNTEMIAKLKKHITRRKGDSDDEEGAYNGSDDDDDSNESSESSSDPRWDTLNDFNENDNN